MAKNNQPLLTEEDIHNKVLSNCNKWLESNTAFSWDDLTDCTDVWNFISLDTDPDDEDLIKEIVWDKLDLQGTLSRETVDSLVYGEDKD